MEAADTITEMKEIAESVSFRFFELLIIDYKNDNENNDCKTSQDLRFSTINKLFLG